MYNQLLILVYKYTVKNLFTSNLVSGLRILDTNIFQQQNYTFYTA